MDTLRITKNQPFVLYVPLVILNADGTKEPVQADTLTDIQVTLQAPCGSTQAIVPTAFEQWLVLSLPATLATSVYNVLVTATLAGGRDFSLRIKGCFEVVEWDEQSNWRDYIVGDHIAIDQAFIAGAYYTDAEYAELKTELRAAIAAAEQAKRDADAAKAAWEQKAAELDGVAQEQTLTDGISAVREDISHIQIDTSDLAKEATLQEVKQIAEQSVISAETIQALSDNLQTMVDNRNELIGWTFSPQFIVNSITDAISHPQYVEEIDDSTITEIYNTSLLFPNLKRLTLNELIFLNSPLNSRLINNGYIQYINLPKLNRIYQDSSVGNHMFENCAILKEVYIPLLEYIADSASNMFRNCPQLRLVDMHSLKRISDLTGNMFTSDIRLIDLRISSQSSFSLSSWNPTEALLTTSQSLLTQEDLDEGFTSNREKLLYNIREHIAGNLPDRTGLTSLTLTMNANVKSAIQADTETANAFANKNWIIA